MAWASGAECLVEDTYAHAATLRMEPGADPGLRRGDHVALCGSWHMAIAVRRGRTSRDVDGWGAVAVRTRVDRLSPATRHGSGTLIGRRSRDNRRRA